MLGPGALGVSKQGLLLKSVALRRISGKPQFLLQGTELLVDGALSFCALPLPQVLELLGPSPLLLRHPLCLLELALEGVKLASKHLILRRQLALRDDFGLERLLLHLVNLSLQPCGLDDLFLVGRDNFFCFFQLVGGIRMQGMPRRGEMTSGRGPEAVDVESHPRLHLP